MSSDPKIAPKAFSGQHGLVVLKEGAGPAELDSSDDVRRLEVDRGVPGVYEPALGDKVADQPVAWDDPAYTAARAAFTAQQAQLADQGTRMGQGLALIKQGRKPPEEYFAKLIAATEAIAGPVGSPSNASPHLRAGAHTTAALGYRSIADTYRMLTGKIEPAKQGYQHIKDAFETQPEHPGASFGYALANVYLQLMPNGWPLKKFDRAQSAMKIEAAHELQRAIVALERQPDDYRAQAALVIAAETWIASSARTKERYADLPERRRKLVGLHHELRTATQRRGKLDGLRKEIDDLTASIARAEALERVAPAFEQRVQSVLNAARARVKELAAQNPQQAQTIDLELAKLRAMIAEAARD